MTLSPSLYDETLIWAMAQISGQGNLRSVTPVRSNEANTVARLAFDDGTLYLKVGLHLRREYDRLGWLQGRLPAPAPVGFTSRDGVDALVMTAVEGDDLAHLSTSLPPWKIVARLVEALQTLHATPVGDWPFGRDEVNADTVSGAVLVHGDACLPNLLFRGETLSGYIDVGDMTLSHPDVDLAAAVWSLQRNLGAGYGLPFLLAYGCADADAAEVERLRRLYETG